MCPVRFLSTLLPYSRKPSPFGPNMSVCAKGVSRGVHNIAFLLSPDRFGAFDLFFFGPHPQPRLGIMKGHQDFARSNKTERRERRWRGHKSKKDICFGLGQACGLCKGKLCDMTHSVDMT